MFQALFQAKGAPADQALAVHAGQFFRDSRALRLRLYDGVPAMLAMLRARGGRLYLLSNAQAIFTTCELRARGGRLYLLSNAQAIFTTCELRALGLEEAFDAVYLSSDYGCKKPDRRFFDLLLTQQHLDPARSIMVGNDPICDAAGGRAAGLDTLFVRSNLSPEGPLPQATFTLPAMDIPRMGAILAGEAVHAG